MRSLLYPNSVYSNISLLYTKSAYSNIFLELTPYIVTFLSPQARYRCVNKPYLFLLLHKWALVSFLHGIIRSFSDSRTFYKQSFFLNTKCYYIRCKYNKQITINSQKICYYKRLCITQIGKLQGPNIYYQHDYQHCPPKCIF